MFQKKQTTRILSLVSIGLVVIAVLLVSVMVLQSKAQEAEPGKTSDGPTAASTSAANPFTCKIDNISVFTDRIQVKCTSSTGGIDIFATSADAGNQLFANRYFDLMQLAYQKSKPLIIYYDSANPPGCLSSDCRNITGLKLRP
jgi:hypothetical protein